MRTLLSVFLFFLLLVSSCKNRQPMQKNTQPVAVEDSSAGEASEIEYDSFGFAYDSTLVKDYRVNKNESLYLILDKLDFSPGQIYYITNKAREVFDVRSLKPGQPYRTYASADPAGGISRLVWQPQPTEYVVFEWDDSLNIYKERKELTTQLAVASAEINNSLYEAITQQGLSPLMAYKLSEIYAWEIDFFGLRKGDSFRMLYEKQYLDGEFYEEGNIRAVELVHRGEMYSAYKFEDEEAGVEGYFDEEGNSVQKALLKAPFTYSQRISSGFSRSRFHPVLKRRIPHYGVDYAAPYGTPVLSVGDGTVTEAQYRGANGNIVNISHNGTYETAYLHLKGFAKGIRPGTRVSQGQIIGYVGKTGRVTGTHLDYRIYKNGRPVNPLTVNLPASRAISEESKHAFDEKQRYYRERLNEIPHPGHRLTTK